MIITNLANILSIIVWEVIINFIFRESDHQSICASLWDMIMQYTGLTGLS